MKSHHAFQTKTMGDLYLKQGYVSEAEAVFKAVLDQDPGRTDCLEALVLCRAKTADQKVQNPGLADLLSCWIGLIREEAGLT